MQREVMVVAVVAAVVSSLLEGRQGVRETVPSERVLGERETGW